MITEAEFNRKIVADSVSFAENIWLEAVEKTGVPLIKGEMDIARVRQLAAAYQAGYLACLKEMAEAQQ